MERQKEFVLRTLEERDIRFVRLWFTDVLGTLKSVSVAPAELESAFDEGIGFDGSAIEGFARVYESDMVAMPDPTTFQVFPFEGRGIGESARMFCDILTPEGAPSWADPRHVLRRSLSKAADRGFTFYVHPEIEFFLFKDIFPETGDKPEPVDDGGYFDHTTHSVARDFRRQAILALERIGISVEFSHHEVAPGQQEIDLRYADALTTADNIMTFRHTIKEVALTSGVTASFMPKPYNTQPGSGMHSHLSLFEGEDNAFHDPGDEQRLSKTAKAFIAGLLRHAPEFTAITNQWVNSYKRLFTSPQPGQISEAPSYVSWGKANRSALVRVPAYGKPNSARVEIRSTRLRDQPVPRLRRAPRRRTQGHRRRLRAAPGHRGRRLGAHQQGARRRRLPAAPGEPRRSPRRHGDLHAGPRGPRRARVRLLPEEQAPGVGGLPHPGDGVRTQAVHQSLTD